MKKALYVVALAVSFFCLAPLPAQTAAPAVEAKWVCNADNMVSGRYSGGDWAIIHLAAYAYGGSYKIAEKGESVVKGKTKDGTPFECKKMTPTPQQTAAPQ